jgi:hypothetical protein
MNCVERHRKWLWPIECPGTSRKNRSEKQNISIRITANELFSHGGGVVLRSFYFECPLFPPTVDHFRKLDVLSVLNGFQCLRASVQPCTRIMRESILLYHIMMCLPSKVELLCVTAVTDWSSIIV